MIIRSINFPASDLPNVFVSFLEDDGDKLLVKTLFIDEIKRQLTYYDETIATIMQIDYIFLNNIH